MSFDKKKKKKQGSYFMLVVFLWRITSLNSRRPLDERPKTGCHANVGYAAFL